MRNPKYRTGTKVAMGSVAKKLNLPIEDWMQDWPYEVVKASDIRKFISHYRMISDDDEKFVLMQAIIQATEDQPNEISFQKYWEQIRPILISDFGIHEYTIYYWARLDGENDTDTWKIGEKMREVWDLATSYRS